MGRKLDKFFRQFFEPSIGCLISPYNLAILRANLAMGRKRGKFLKKNQQGKQKIMNTDGEEIGNFSTNLYGPNDGS